MGLAFEQYSHTAYSTYILKICSVYYIPICTYRDMGEYNELVHGGRKEFRIWNSWHLASCSFACISLYPVYNIV